LLGICLNLIKKSYNNLKGWFNNSPEIIRVDKKKLKLLKDGQYGDVIIIGKTFEDPDKRVVGVKGNSEHAVSLPDDWAEEIANNENHKISIIKVVTESNKKILILCENDCDIIKNIYKVEKQ
jgi:hypothetical protein